MPADGVNLSPKEHALTSEEINKLASIFVSKLGIKKIRLTGGGTVGTKGHSSSDTKIVNT